VTAWPSLHRISRRPPGAQSDTLKCRRGCAAILLFFYEQPSNLFKLLLKFRNGENPATARSQAQELFQISEVSAFLAMSGAAIPRAFPQTPKPD